jgi:hypothetical protein
MARVTPAARIHLGGTTAIYREAFNFGESSDRPCIRWHSWLLFGSADPETSPVLGSKAARGQSEQMRGGGGRTRASSADPGPAPLSGRVLVASWALALERSDCHRAARTTPGQGRFRPCLAVVQIRFRD